MAIESWSGWGGAIATFATTPEVAAMNWGEERISTVLRELNVAMGEEVREIEGWQSPVH